jgi:histidinol-phosphate aminotransferase
LAGVRIGFCIGTKKRILTLKNIQQVFPISSPALTIATAASEDTAFIQKTRSFISKERIRVKKEIEKMGCAVSDSVTNTLFISTPDATKIITQLNTLGVSVIPNAFFPGLTTPGFRIALRDTQTNTLFLKKLNQAIESLGINLLR